jgi:disulfide bond formation protein DsbB
VSAPDLRPAGPGSQVWFAASAALAVAAVAIALVTQHGFGMQPCPWCVLQRAIFVAIALAALLGCVWRSPTGRLSSALATAVLAGLGVAAALWHYFVASDSASCNLTLADRIVSGLALDTLLPPVFAATASCADAKVRLLGLPYPFWSLGVFVAIGAVVFGKILLGKHAAANAATR